VKEHLDRLKSVSSLLEPTADQRALWTEKVVAHAEQLLAGLPQRPAFLSAKDEGKGILSSPLCEEPQDADAVLRSFAEHVENPGVKLGSPGYLAFIPISTVYSAALGDYLAAVANPYVGNFFASPGAVRLEHSLTRWMADFVGYPKTSAGDLTSGGSIANLSAIIAAREARGLKARDYERAVVYLTSQTHHSVTKALRIAGLGECIQRQIPLDDAFRMKADSLDKAIRNDMSDGLLPWLVAAAAGSTDVGAVDPLNDLVALARKHGLWLHVDGAYGAMFALCEAGKARLSGLEHSDSLVLDPHKGLFMPCGSGAVLVRNGQHLRNAYHYEAHYMQDRSALASLDEFSPSELSPELTRPFRGLRLWLSLKLIGLRAFRAALEEKLLLAGYFYEKVREIDGIQVGPPPDLSIVAFRFVPNKGDADDFNQRLLKEINEDGHVFLTSTRLNGSFWLRVAVLCTATHREQMDLALEILRNKLAKTEAV
jgi:glutamate/tyrosine decarboxylase-like PLP-dependent enzyme